MRLTLKGLREFSVRNSFGTNDTKMWMKISSSKLSVVGTAWRHPLQKDARWKRNSERARQKSAPRADFGLDFL